MAAKRKYPWEDWFASGDVTLMQGSDYDCSQAAMAQTCRNNATRFGYYVRITDLGIAIRIEVTGERDDSVHTDQAAVAQ